jgi:peptidoglycan/LPS O-acetylase OafA/YrhL
MVNSESQLSPNTVTTAQTAGGFRADIEGLRAVAILFVVAFHAGIRGASGGFVGVDVFFVLSGYLITALLVREIDTTGRIDLLGFYVRRARRLLPGLLFLVAVVCGFSYWLLSPQEQSVVSRTAFSTALYYSNVWFSRNSVRYLDTPADDNPLLHTWSLAVEEQFYLAWPVLVIGVLRFTRPERRIAVLCWAAAGIVATSFLLSLYQVRTVQPRAFFGAPARAWEFAIGAIVAVRSFTDPMSRLAALRNGLAALGFIMLFAAVIGYSRQTAFPGIAALLPAVGTGFVLVSHGGAPSSAMHRVLVSPVMQWIGRRSYSWYLWHWPLPVLAVAMVGPLSVPVRVVLSLVALAIAHVVFEWLEWPIRSRQRLDVRPTASALLAVAASLAIALVAARWSVASDRAANSSAQRRFTAARADLPKVYALQCHLDYVETQPRGCEFGSPSSQTRVMLIGDSHAAQWFPAIERIADSLQWRLSYASKSSCPAVAIPVYLERFKREYRECAQWRSHVLEQIAVLRPSLVIVANATSYVLGGTVADGGPLIDRVHWRDGIRDLILAIRSRAGRVVLLADIPPAGFDIPTCLARAVWQGRGSSFFCGFVPDTGIVSRSGERDGAALGGASYLEFGPLVCREICLPERDGLVVFRDDNHLTASFSRTLASQIARPLAAELPR